GGSSPRSWCWSASPGVRCWRILSSILWQRCSSPQITNRNNFFRLCIPCACCNTAHMNDLALSLRQARPSDAADLARIYIESWQDTYAGILPHSLLSAMSLKTHTIRWQNQLRAPGTVIVTEDRTHGIIGFASLGGARDPGLGFEGEVYTLYVDPAFF